jgi:hypothetical protein
MYRSESGEFEVASMFMGIGFWKIGKPKKLGCDLTGGVHLRDWSDILEEVLLHSGKLVAYSMIEFEQHIRY